MFTVYRWDAAGDRWIAERTFPTSGLAYRYARDLETVGTAVRTIVRRSPPMK